MRDFAGPGPYDAGLATAIIKMGQALNMTVVAQGVETESQAEFLRLRACDELQGFYFKKPMPADEMAKLLYGQGPESPTCWSAWM